MPVTEALFKAFEGSLLIIGVVLWVRALTRGLAPAWIDAPARLPSWSIGIGDFLLLPLIVLLLLVFLPYGLAQAFGVVATQPPSAEAMLLAGFGWGAAFTAGTLLFRLIPGGHAPEGRESLIRCVLTGLLALVYFLPVCTGLGLGFTWVLDQLHVPHDVQEIVQMIRNTSSPGMLALWLLVVVVVAPVGEELVFRAGLFRFLVNRMRPGLAATVSAAVFAALHLNLQSSLPLFVLGLVLAGLYHKSGRIITSIVLHATFNLNTLLGILSGAVQ